MIPYHPKVSLLGSLKVPAEKDESYLGSWDRSPSGSCISGSLLKRQCQARAFAFAENFPEPFNQHLCGNCILFIFRYLFNSGGWISQRDPRAVS